MNGMLPENLMFNPYFCVSRCSSVWYLSTLCPMICCPLDDNHSRIYQAVWGWLCVFFCHCWIRYIWSCGNRRLAIVSFHSERCMAVVVRYTDCYIADQVSYQTRYWSVRTDNLPSYSCVRLVPIRSMSWSHSWPNSIACELRYVYHHTVADDQKLMLLRRA